jgi:hypothetical protein
LEYSLREIVVNAPYPLMVCGQMMLESIDSWWSMRLIDAVGRCGWSMRLVDAVGRCGWSMRLVDAVHFVHRHPTFTGILH